MRKLLFGTLAASLAMLPGLGADAQTVVSANVETDTTWSGEIVLQNPIFVKSGATLTIAPGTIVRGQPRTAAVLAGSTVGTPGTLIVTQSGTIIANGTPNNPIIMTTAAVDNNDDGVPDDDDVNGFRDSWAPGDIFYDDTPTTAPLAPLNTAGGANVALWGGVVVLGNASTNLSNPCGTGQGSCTVEGLTVPGFPVSDATYGGPTPGANDADSSGSLSFISVRHAGDEIGNSNELNGVTLAGVGTGTEFHHIEIYCNFDDGIEWFGGTVNGHHLHVAFAGDDSFDVDQGYRGTNQFLSTIMTYFNVLGGGPYGASSGDKGCECDGDDWDEPTIGTRVNVVDIGGGVMQPTPFSNTTWWNFTVAGSAQPSTFNGHTNDNDGWEVRNGFAGTANNGIIYDTGVRQGYDDAGAGTDFPPAGAAGGDFRTPANATAGLIAVNNLTCNNVTTIPAAPAAENTALNVNGTGNIGCNGVNDGGYGLVAETTSFTPTGVSGKLDASLATIDLRPINSNPTLTGAVPPGSLDETADYRGAFAPSPTAHWLHTWTAMGEAGMLPEPGSLSTLAAGAVLLMFLKRRR